MIKRIYEYLADRGFMVMMVGFFLAVVGLILFMQSNRAAPVVPKIYFAVTVAGFAVYVIGRVLVAVQRRRAKRKSYETEADQKDSA